MKMLRVLSALTLVFGTLVAIAPAQAATVKITVNGQPITDIQIAQRLALLKLEHKNDPKEATTELINEALETQ